MKCSEFMIGDWLQDSHHFPMQVTSVGEDWLCANFEGNEGDVWEFDDKLEPPYPIPLTEEILKKNGFIPTGSRDNDWCLLTEYLTKDIRYNLYVGIQKKNIELFVAPPVFTDAKKTYRKHNNINLQVCEHNVHTLQQALRLAGLKELANNFKV